MLGFSFFFFGGGDKIKTKRHREHKKCLNREFVHIYPLNQLISNVIPATGLKKVSGQQKAEKMTFENVQLGEHLATKLIYIRSRYKRDVLEGQSLSEVKMGRGSPICERVHTKVVEYFKNKVPSYIIAKTLQISSSTVHNIIKRFRETGETLWVRDNAEDLCWMRVVLGPSDDTVSLIGMILTLALLNGPSNTSRTQCW